jgi:hypothetical protein
VGVLQQHRRKVGLVTVERPEVLEYQTLAVVAGAAQLQQTQREVLEDLELSLSPILLHTMHCLQLAVA